MKKVLKSFLAVIMSVVMVMSIVGCVAPATETQTKTTTQTQTKTVTTTVYTNPIQIIATNETYKELFDKFTKDTGIKYQMLSMSSGAVLTKLRAEGKNSTFDVWFGGGINDFINAGEEGFLAPVDFNGVDKLNPLFVGPNNTYFGKGMTIVGFAVNMDVIKEKGLDVPTSWDDLVDPQYKDEIVFSDPSVSGTCYAVLYALMQTKGEEYVKQFSDNLLFLGSRGKDPIEKAVAGECAIGVTYIDGTLAGIIGDANVEIVYPTDGIPWTPEGVAVIANSPNNDAAKVFIDWFYNDDANLQLLAKIDQKGAIKAIKPSLTGVELDYEIDTLMNLDLSQYASKATEYKEFFASLQK